MHNISQYIIEKLKLSKDTQSDVVFKNGDPIVRVAINHFYENDNADELVVNLMHSYGEPILLSFIKFARGEQIIFSRSDSKNTDSFSYEKNGFINSNGYYEYHSENKGMWFCWSVYLDLNGGISFLEELIKHNGKPAILYPYFDEDDNLNSGITLQNPKKQINRLYNELKKL